MDNEKLYEDMKPKEKFEVLWAESGLADRPGAENLWQQMVALDSLKSLPALSTIPTIPAVCVSTRFVWQRRQWSCAEQITFSRSVTGMKFLRRRSCTTIARWASTAIKATASTNTLTPVWWARRRKRHHGTAVHQADSAGDCGNPLAHGSVQRGRRTGIRSVLFMTATRRPCACTSRI